MGLNQRHLDPRFRGGDGLCICKEALDTLDTSFPFTARFLSHLRRQPAFIRRLHRPNRLEI